MVKAVMQRGEPMDDLISRQAAIDAIMGQPPEPHYPSWYAAQIEKLPPAQPERKKGQWMKEDRGHVEYCAVCDQCGFDWIWSDREYFKFCPNCGADMRGEQDG